MMRWSVGVLAVAFLAGCGKKEDEDPGKKALESLREFATAYPGTEWEDQRSKHSCDFSKTDVLKSNSEASPFTGVIEGVATQDFGNEMPSMRWAFNLRFRNEGDSWKCDPAQSEAINILPSGDPGDPWDMPCMLLNRHCLGKSEVPE